MRTWMKAGLIGGAIQILLTIPSIAVYIFPSKAIGLISCIICLPFFLVYFLPGILAARWMAPPRTVNQAAKDGSLAGLVAGAQIAQSVCFLFVHLALGVGIGCLSAVIYAAL